MQSRRQGSAGHRCESRARAPRSPSSWRRAARASCWSRARRGARRVVGEIARGGGEAHALAADVGDKDAIHRIAGAAAALVGPIDRARPQREHARPDAAAAAARHRVRGLRARARGQPARAVPADARRSPARWRCAGAGSIVHISSDAARRARIRAGARTGVSKAALGSPVRGSSRPSWTSIGVRVLERRSGRDGHADARRRDARGRSRDARRPGRGRRAHRATLIERAERVADWRAAWKQRAKRWRHEGRELAAAGSARRAAAAARSGERCAARCADRRDLPALLAPGDVLVVNDAATLPASLRAEVDGAAVELRLLGVARARSAIGGRCCSARATGARPPSIGPRRRRSRSGAAARRRGFARGDRARRSQVRAPGRAALRPRGRATAGTRCTRTAGPCSTRTSIERSRCGRCRTALRRGRGRSRCRRRARPLTWGLLRALRRRGVELAAITHAAGLSSTGSDALDQRLPMPERYSVPLDTVAAIRAARRAADA